MREAGVDRMFVVGFDTPTIERAMELIEQYDFIYGIIGWHPVDAIDFTDERLQWIEELSQHPKVIGIGEMGLIIGINLQLMFKKTYLESKLLSLKSELAYHYS